VLKGDIKSFFASIDHELLINILKEYIPDKYIIWLLKNIINSFQTREGKGLPLGNLTSQLFANIYLNEFDQFVKHKIKAKFYIRYVDDFTILSDNKKWLENQINLIVYTYFAGGGSVATRRILAVNSSIWKCGLR